MSLSGPSYRAGRCLLIGGKADIEPNITECPSLTQADLENSNEIESEAYFSRWCVSVWTPTYADYLLKMMM
jgi:hypothetical protein